MQVIVVLFWLLVIGLAVYAVNRWVPMSDPYKTIFNAVAIIATVIWLLLMLASWLGIATFPGAFPAFRR